MPDDTQAPQEAAPSAMAQALVSELASHLARLVEDGTEARVDLRSLPMAPFDLDALKTLLGTGEVTAEIAGHGRTAIQETAYAGVWWLSHYDVHGALLMEEIEIAVVPEILGADQGEMARAAQTMSDGLAAPSGRRPQ